MIRKTLLNTYPDPLSVICLGTAKYGDEYDEKRSFEILDAYYAMGGRFIDTANVYGRWGTRGLNESEIVIGKWMKLRGVADMTVMTKCCHYLPDSKDVSRVNRTEAVKDLDESRKTLGLDEIPVLLTHRDNEGTDVRDIVDFLAEAVIAGKIRRFGFSNYRAERIAGAIEYLGETWRDYFFGVSNEWNLHEECSAMDSGGAEKVENGMVTVGRTLYGYQHSCGLPLLPYKAAAGGFFDKLKSTEMLTEREKKVYGSVCREAAGHNVSRTSVALAYLINSGVNAIPIVSVSSAPQLAAFEEVSEWKGDLSYLCQFDPDS